MSNAAEDKAAFFAQLYALNQSQDDEYEEDPGRRFPINPQVPPAPSPPIQVSGSSFSVPDPPGVSVTAGMTRTPDLRRRDTEPSVGTGRVKETPLLPRRAKLHSSKTPTPLATEVLFVEETPLARGQLLDRVEPRRTVSAPVPSAKPMESLQATENDKSSALGKRKRKGSGASMIPEKKQIFRPFTFFYVPNDDKNPVRRERIAKAQQYGATWTTTWEPAITHVIVDANLNYKDVVTFLKIPAIPDKVKLVRDIYPLHCIQYGRELHLPQKQYMVEGCDESSIESSPSASAISDTSLKLKPQQSRSGKWDYVPELDTPPKSEQSASGGLKTGDSVHHRGNLSPGVESTDESDTKRLIPTNPTFQTPIAQKTFNRDEYPILGAKNDDELQLAIQDAQQNKDISFEDGDRPSSRGSTFCDDSGSDDGQFSDPSTEGSFSKKTKGQEYFQCMKGGTGKQDVDNPNMLIISKLQEMADIYTKRGDTWRSRAYRKVITQVKSLAVKVISAKHARQIPGVGHRLALKIEEIATTGDLQRLESAKEDPFGKILEIFLNIYGVGITQASKWIIQGHKTLEDLRVHAHLTEYQRMGIEHYDDLLDRIPRAEVTALGRVVTEAAARIDSKVQCIIGGSYRRGSETSGDIDIIITKPGTTTSSEIKQFLDNLTSALTESGFLVYTIAKSSDKDGTKWHGCCVLPNHKGEADRKQIWRRIDFLLVPESELGAALIYFTGNDIFNRSIRLLASRKGMRLNQKGLFKNCLRGPGRRKMNDGELVEGRYEERIFEVLGVTWRPPHERIC